MALFDFLKKKERIKKSGRKNHLSERYPLLSVLSGSNNATLIVSILAHRHISTLFACFQAYNKKVPHFQQVNNNQIVILSKGVF